MVYQNLGASALEYYPCRYGKSKLLFRGPKHNLADRYVSVIGGTEAYGKFVERPFATLLGEKIGRTVANFGLVNAGLDVFGHDDMVMNACSNAEVTVIQITGAQNMSNRFYAVHPRRNDRFLRASALLKSIYRDMDFTEFNFTRHLLTALRREGLEKFAMVERELKDAWVARMKMLVSRIESRVVLLWLADHAPYENPSCSTDGSDPLFVDRQMLREVAPFASTLVEVVVSADDIRAGHTGMVFSDLEEPAAHELLGTIAHERAAAALAPVLDRLM